jgi:hypothetical protein
MEKYKLAYKVDQDARVAKVLPEVNWYHWTIEA